MDTPTTDRALTPARVVALAAIALAVIGLAYLRFAPERSLSVPTGAKAGDLFLERCHYATEDGAYDADCGTLVVPENRADSQSRLIAIPVTRIRAASPRPKEPIFRLEGGPGGTNMEFSNASRFAGERDVVLVGYRGVDGSVRLDCPEVESELARSTNVLGRTSLRAYGDAFGACAARLAGEGVDVTRYGLVQQVDDLEAARKALGYGRVDLLSESAGTRTALIYAWRYPESIHRSVMIGANPPGRFLWDPKTTDELIDRYAALCAADGACSRRTDDLAATLRREARAVPDRWLAFPIEKGNVRVASFMGLMESTAAASPASGPMTLDTWLSAAEGDASGLWFASLAGDLLFPKMFVWGQYAAAGSIDAEAARDYFSSPRPEPASSLAAAITAFAWGGGRVVETWPAAAGAGAYRRMRPSDVETLVISGALDFSTPPQLATEELLPYLPNGRQVVLPGFGHTISFWEEQPEAGTRLVNAFLDGGRVDNSLYAPQQVDLSPSFTQPAIAKIVAGALAGLALLVPLALLWMARRVRRRGRFGRTASVTLRSLAPAVLGLGGWALGALVVLTAIPAVPLDDAVLAAVSVGAPVGLGVYLAWVDRALPGGARWLGVAAAAGGALLGAWLGFHVTEGTVAVVTAIAGAAIGANLALVGLDLSSAPHGRARGTAAAAAARHETRPAAG